jgi:hypothetical protein
VQGGPTFEEVQPLLETLRKNVAERPGTVGWYDGSLLDVTSNTCNLLILSDTSDATAPVALSGFRDECHRTLTNTFTYLCRQYERGIFRTPPAENRAP